MIQILVVDDDAHIQHLIAMYIEQEGYKPVKANDGKEAVAILEQQGIDLAIIDLMMPNMDGYELCEEIRRYYEIPVLMVTAKGEVQDKVKGFQLGTDDYVVKPFEPIELMMRVKALMRRYNIQSAHYIEMGNVRLNERNKTVEVKDGSETWPLKEFDLLYTLASYPEQIFTRNQLIEKHWGLDYEGDDRTVDVHIKRIRDKLKKYEASISIKTIRGVGYRIEEVTV
ncbi:heme response regulator HssR [Pontibacillus halophilus JSM 076056 = DSM 19796]|uniref:Heme response regulator HssR n=1 Tax=Pontibacillus halophilus JSM 076056 = DSM 19796 TaxID=1385510 RepID=A0A0A5I6B3_9BACI|nr:response regulator transcription factor [Pontibacillus halophilus]KGX91372.1 heme response regulator HssR [Pontibacillus halophilus JSM 076056 = DSM 19796]